MKKNKYLSLCDSIEEIYEQIIFNINKKNLQIIENTNQILINIPIEHLKVKEIIFIVPEKIKKDSEKFEDLNNEITTLKSNLKDIEKNLNEKIKSLERENNNLKRRITFLEGDKSIFNQKIIEFNKIFMLNKNTIIKNEIDKKNSIINRIKEKTKKKTNRI